MSPITIGTLLDTNDVSKLLKVSAATLASWRSRGDGPDFLRIGNVIPWVYLGFKPGTEI